jgi:hypothetical protein
VAMRLDEGGDPCDDEDRADERLSHRLGRVAHRRVPPDNARNVPAFATRYLTLREWCCARPRDDPGL